MSPQLSTIMPTMSQRHTFYDTGNASGTQYQGSTTVPPARQAMGTIGPWPPEVCPAYSLTGVWPSKYNGMHRGPINVGTWIVQS
jgi:hypothetical protein